MGWCFTSWALADVVEEMKDLSKNIEISFMHVKRRANATDDLLAKEGVGHQNLSIQLFDF